MDMQLYITVLCYKESEVFIVSELPWRVSNPIAIFCASIIKPKITFKIHCKVLRQRKNTIFVLSSLAYMQEENSWCLSSRKKMSCGIHSKKWKGEDRQTDPVLAQYTALSAIAHHFRFTNFWKSVAL